MMQSNNREFAGKNEFWTPSSIGLTQSMIDSSINNILLNDNSSDLFKIEDNKLKTVDDLPIESKNFIISGTNDEIDSNENNAVNKRYLSNKIGNLDDKYMKKDVKSLNLNELNINSVSDHNLKISSVTEANTDPFITFSHTKPVNGINSTHYLMYMNRDRIYITKPLAISYSSGIDFNTSSKGVAVKADYPKTNLKNLVTSDITAAQLKKLTSNTDNVTLDNVCPTYKYCENTYAKAGTGGFSQITRTVIYPLDETGKDYVINNIVNLSKNDFKTSYDIKNLPTIGDVRIIKIYFEIYSTVLEEGKDLICSLEYPIDGGVYKEEAKKGTFLRKAQGTAYGTCYVFSFYFEHTFYDKNSKIYLYFGNESLDSTATTFINRPLTHTTGSFKVEIITIST